MLRQNGLPLGTRPHTRAPVWLARRRKCLLRWRKVSRHGMPALPSARLAGGVPRGAWRSSTVDGTGRGSHWGFMTGPGARVNLVAVGMFNGWTTSADLGSSTSRLNSAILVSSSFSGGCTPRPSTCRGSVLGQIAELRHNMAAILEYYVPSTRTASGTYGWSGTATGETPPERLTATVQRRPRSLPRIFRNRSGTAPNSSRPSLCSSC